MSDRDANMRELELHRALGYLLHAVEMEQPGLLRRITTMAHAGEELHPTATKAGITAQLEEWCRLVGAK